MVWRLTSLSSLLLLTGTACADTQPRLWHQPDKFDIATRGTGRDKFAGIHDAAAIEASPHLAHHHESSSLNNHFM
jgi:hypothetical protein